MQIELRNLQKSLGITFTFVTQDQEEAMTMLIEFVMDEGNILQVSPQKKFIIILKINLFLNLLVILIYWMLTLKMFQMKICQLK